MRHASLFNCFTRKELAASGRQQPGLRRTILIVEELEGRVVPSTVTVTTTADSTTNTGSLRYILANLGSGTTTIDFNIPTSDPGYNATTKVWTITPTASNGGAFYISRPVILDGTSQPGYAAAGHPLIELNGTSAGSMADGLDIAAGSTTVKGLAINRFGGDGISIFNTGNDVITGNYLGTDPTGTTAQPNNVLDILIQTSNNTIGGTTAALPNVISGSTADGLQLYGSGATGNLVEGNFIGTNATGTTAVPNAILGVFISFGATHNTIGGTTAAARNIISGNTDTGVQIYGTGTSNNVIEGNYIGINASGSAALANNILGVFINNSATQNTIGGSTPAARNIISGNGNSGLQIDGTGTSNNVVEGNYIGTNPTATGAIANSDDGVFISTGATQNTIGGSTAGALNVISGNAQIGVQVYGTGTSGNLVEGNDIGTQAGGTAALANGTVGNFGAGVYINQGASNNVIGGSAAQGNVIAFNLGSGVAVPDPTSTGNAIRGNSIFGNSALGIDLGNSGVQVNHAGTTTGANNLQNYPVLTAATAGTTTTVSGSLTSLPSTTYVLDFYANPTHDITFYGPGQIYLGSMNVTTNASGFVAFTATLSAATTTGQWITATATDPSGNTSEFAGDLQLPTAPLTLSTSTWTAIGPAPVAQSPAYSPIMSGRVTDAVPDPANPNVMYLTADGGGVWKTTDWLDPSPVWTPLTDPQSSVSPTNSSYTALVVFPGNPNILFVTVSGPGGGILKSANGGATWTLLGNAYFDQASFSSLVVDPHNVNSIYVSVWYGPPGGVYHSTDGGFTWTNITTRVHSGAASDVVMDPTNSSILYAGLVQDPNNGASDGLYKTTDGGATWTLLSGGLLTGSAVGVTIRVAVAPSAPQTVYATVFDPSLGSSPDGLPHRYQSLNGGTSWTSLPQLPTNEESRYWHVVLTVDPSNSQIVYINGDHTMYQTTTGGSTWNQFDNYEDPVGLYFDDSGSYILVGDHGIYRQASPGLSYTNKQGNLQTSEFYTLTLDPTNPAIAYGIAQDQFEPLKYDGYPVWTAMPITSTATDGTGETGQILVDPTSPNVLYQYAPANAASFVLMSTDGGASWTNDGNGIPTTAAGFALAYASEYAALIDPTNHNRLLVGTDQVYETTNDGSSWHSISPISPTFNPNDQFITGLAVAPSAPNTIYVGTLDGRFFLTTNDGGTWQEIDADLPRDSADDISSITVNPTNPQEAFIVPGTFPTAVFGPTHVWMTMNGGANWIDITGSLPREDWTNAIVADWRFSTPVLYVGTARGVYQSVNLGSTWTLFGQGLPNSPVTDLQFVPGLNLMAVATYGRGAYEITIPGPAVSITTTSLPAWTAYEPGYSQTLAASGGAGGYTFSAPPASLPPGLTLSPSGVLSGTPTAVGTYSFTVTATDAEGDTGSQTLSLTINPLQYLVSVASPSTVAAGSTFVVTVQAADQIGNPITSYSGPSSLTATISPPSSSSTFPTTVTLNGAGFGFFLASVKQAGTYTITAAAAGFTGSTATPLIVTPAAAAKLAFSAPPASTPTGVVLPTVIVLVQDAFGNVIASDNSDTVTLSVASGPGSFATGSTTAVKVVNGMASFSNLELITPGTYTFGAVVAGLYTGAPSSSFTVLPLQVVAGSFVGTPTGFSIQFNAPFLVNSTTPVLYGTGFGSTAPPPSVIVTTDPGNLHDTAAIVTGSLVLNTAANSIAFVATNSTLVVNHSTPVLPDGTYTVIVRSSAATDGFQALNAGGGFLDGKGTGVAGSGDYTATFTVNASAAHDAIVWIPPSADGPGQPLNAPGKNQAGGGYPLYLDSTGGVTKVQVTLNYNPALLTVTGVTGANFSLLGTSTPGHALLQYSGPALATGMQTPVGFITATVPGGTTASPEPYKAKDLLHLSSVAINGASTGVVSSDALHLVAYVGDSDGNGAYSSNDAVLITRVLVSTDSGFTAYPLVDPVVVADTDGAGFIPADAALQANEAGVGFPTANLASPPIPPGVVFQAIGNNVDPQLSLVIRPLSFANDQGQMTNDYAVAVNIDDPHPPGSTGLIRATLALRYDPRAFSVSAADIHLGSVPLAGAGWTLISTINPLTGEIAIELSSTTPIDSSLGGSLVTIDFHPIAGLSASPAIELVTSVNPTGQQVLWTQLQDAQGTFTLTLAPAAQFAPGIDAEAMMKLWDTLGWFNLKSDLDRQEFGLNAGTGIPWR